MTALRALLAVVGIAATVLVGSRMLAADADARFVAVVDRPVAARAAEVLLLVDGTDPYAAPVVEHVRTALGRTRVAFAEHDLASGQPLPPLGSMQAVLTVVERLGQMSDEDARELSAFVRGGGGLAVLYRGHDARLAGLLGVELTGAPRFSTAPEPLTFTDALMPGGDDLTLQPVALSALDVRAASDCDVFAEREQGRPLAWTCARGAGRVVFWNTVALGAKAFRGHLLQSLALVHPAHVRPMAGWATVYLDDFPSPASNQRVEPIWSAHGESPATFYAHRWYPDMVAIGERYDLPYTSTVIYSYNGRTTPPFDLGEWLTGRVQSFGGLVPYAPYIMAEDAGRSELALHGYNHEPLRLDVWGTQAPMIDALRVARRRWVSEDAAPLPTTYVPPMNRIDSVGVAALRAAFPETRTIAGLYFGPSELGQDREFGPEPWAPEVYALPRNTAGYVMGDEARLRTLTLLTSLGVWSHFVHPDDVYPNADRATSYREMGLDDPAALGWEGGDGLRAAFERWVRFVQLRYPWIDFVTARQAADRMHAFDRLSLASTPRDEADGRALALRLSQPRQTVVTWARPGEALVEVDGGTIVDVWEGPLLTQYTVRASGLDVSLRFRDLPTP
ncbi:DUF2194 domain-containing protein [Rubrivirga sp. IMCC45206]|uniref:DUF2194 domain-containing protein n=1 Tax=Rubrivirga sp. IMCC45206 TaxID=3391614 RepID=UPI00398FE701